MKNFLLIASYLLLLMGAAMILFGGHTEDVRLISLGIIAFFMGGLNVFSSLAAIMSGK